MYSTINFQIVKPTNYTVRMYVHARVFYEGFFCTYQYMYIHVLVAAGGPAGY